MAAQPSFDFVVLGGGPAGLAAAQRAVELGRRTALVAPRPLGGACVNWGCLPVRYLRQAAAVRAQGALAPFPGLGLAPGLPDWVALQEGKAAFLARIAAERYEQSVRQRIGLHWFPSSGRFLGPHEVAADGQVLRAEQVLVATGRRSWLAPELKAVDALTPAEALLLNELPRSVIVLGSDGQSLEVAQLLARFGSSVMVVETAERFAPEQEVRVAQALEAALSDEGIEVWTGVSLEGLRRDGREVVVTLWDAEEELRIELRGEACVAAGEPRGNTDGLGLTEVGCALDEAGFLRVDETFRTSVEGVWAAGDVVGGPFLASVAGRMGTLAAENALRGAQRTLDLALVPRVIWTDPEVARVGLGEAEAWQQGYRVKSVFWDLARLPAAAAMGYKHGVLMLVAEMNTEELLGAHLVAPGAAELVHALALAIRGKLTFQELGELLYATPTVAEGVRMAIQTLQRSPDLVSCCPS